MMAKLPLLQSLVSQDLSDLFKIRWYIKEHLFKIEIFCNILFCIQKEDTEWNVMLVWYTDGKADVRVLKKQQNYT